MNSSAISWISQQGMDSSMLMDQCDFTDPFDEDLATGYGDDLSNYLNSGSNSIASSTVINIPATASNSINSLYTSPETEQAKQETTDSYSNFSAMLGLANPLILNFGSQNPPENVQQVNRIAPNPEEEVAVPEVFNSLGTNDVNSDEAIIPRVQPKKKKRIRPPSQTYDHIIAERRRREQLSQLFVALSALIPGLKKMDKSSILEDAIKYMKLLKERVKFLEEKTEKKTMESVVLVKKSQIVIDDDEESPDEQSSSFDEQPLPEIETRVCENNIFIRVHCEKDKDVLVKLICKVESLNMIIVSTNATPFGNVALHITIVAEMEKEFNLSGKEVGTALREALQLAS